MPGGPVAARMVLCYDAPMDTTGDTVARPWTHASLWRCIPRAAKRVLDCTPDAAFGREAVRRGDVSLTGLIPDEGTGPFGGYEALISADLEDPSLSFEDGAFDAVVCDDILADLRDPEPLLHALARVLHPAGVFVLTFPNLQYHRNQFMLAEGRWSMGESLALQPRRLRFFTVHEMAGLLLRCGLYAPNCEVLVGDPPERLPRNAEGYIEKGKVSIGPLSDHEHSVVLAEQFLIVARRAAGA